MKKYEETKNPFIEEIIKVTGIEDRKLLRAFATVPRERFVLQQFQNQAYEDRALPIEEGQTISQPSLVALMTHFLDLKGRGKVLEIGTGSGYQAAILSNLAGEVHTIERIPYLAHKASKLFKELGYKNIRVYVQDGTLGLAKEAPFDAIIVTAGAKELPQALVEQLKVGGRLVIPVNESFGQRLKLVTKTHSGVQTKDLGAVAFVPLIGKYRLDK